MTLYLSERADSSPVRLTREQREGLRRHLHAELEPWDDGLVVVKPGDRVGVAQIAGLGVVVQPKLPISRLLTLLSQTADPYGWRPGDVQGLSATTVADGVAGLFAQSCQRTFARGLHQSYRKEDQALPFVKGRLNLRRNLQNPAPLPIHVTTGVFDSNNAENQVLRATLDQLRTSPGLSDRTRRMAQRAWNDVSHVKPVRDPLQTLQSISWTRHNQHYKPALALAEIVLSGTGGRFVAAETEKDALTVPGFLLDMPAVVEEWTRSQLRSQWGLTELQMPSAPDRHLWLDTGRRIKLLPDLTVKERGEWRFVGDVKYKRFPKEGVLRQDIHQLLTYMVGTGLDQGTLIYVGEQGKDVSHRFALQDKRINAVSVDLSLENPSDQLRAKLPAPR